MQSVSADLAAAIETTDERPQVLVRLRVDWDRDGDYTDTDSDLSADVVSVDLSRELATDLPPEAKLFSGVATAQATITLVHRDPAGDPAKHGAWYYSPLNSASPLFGVDRKGAPATLEFGFVTATGPEYVTVLAGTVRSLQVTSGGRVAVMRVEDRAASMRRQITLPMMVADGANEAGTLIQVGLTTSFLADWVLRACGWYTSPPLRSGAKFAATMHGSAYPEVGTPRHVETGTGLAPIFAPSPDRTTAAKFVSALNSEPSSTQAFNYFLGGSGVISTNNTRTMLFEGWFKFDTVANDQPLFKVALEGASVPWISGWWQQSTGRFKLSFNRASTDNTNRAADGPVVSPGTTDWHYWAVHVSFTSTGVDCTFRYDGTTTGPVNVATPSVTGASALDLAVIGNGKVSSFSDDDFDGLIEAVQLTTEASAANWNDAFVPTAQVVTSPTVDATLAATPVASEEGWTLLQQLAEAEYATAGFTETGLAFYWPRTRWTTAPYTTSQRTLTASNALVELESVEAIDQVRNHVVATARTPVVMSAQALWSLQDKLAVNASSSRTIWANFTDPVANLDTTFTYSASGSDATRYLAGTSPTGVGSQVSNLTFAVTPFAQSAKIVVTNPNAFRIWLIADANGSATFAGKPYLILNGQPVLFDSDDAGIQRSDQSDATSISNYGEQLLELDDNPFRQLLAMIEGLTTALVTDLADPGPTLSDVPAVADIRLQLGDRVTIVDPDGLAISADFHLSKIDFSFDSGGLGMVLGLRSA